MGTLLWPTDKILLFIFIVTAMMEITLQATPREIVRELRNQSLVIRALVVNLVLVPILGICLVKLLPMAPDAKDGILLLALAPGEVLAINFTKKLCARIELAAAMLFLLTLVGAVLTPILAKWLLESDLPVEMHYGRMLKIIMVYMVLPLIAGMALERSVPRIAARLQKPIGIVSGLAFIAFTIATASQKSSAVKTIAGGGTLLGLVLLIAGGMMLGWFLGGSDPETRRVMTVNSGLKSLALSLAIATRSFPGTNVDLTILAYAALGIPIAFLFTFYQQRKIKRLPQQRVASAA